MRAALLFLALLIAEACQKPGGSVVARVGDVAFTEAQLRASYALANQQDRELYRTDPVGFLYDLVVRDEALYVEARRLDLAASAPTGGALSKEALIAAMQERIVDEQRTLLKPEDLPDSAIMEIANHDPRLSFQPARTDVIAMVFTRPADAQQAASAARSARDDDGFRAAYLQLARRIQSQLGKGVSMASRAELWEFSVPRIDRSPWPQALVDELFSARIGAVLGPVEALVEPYDSPRHFVMKVVFRAGERNTIGELRTRLEMEVFDRELRKSIKARTRKLVEATTVIVDPSMLKALSLDGPH